MKNAVIHINNKIYMLAHRRASRMEELESHGKQILFRTALHESKKAYNRQKEKRIIRDLLHYE